MNEIASGPEALSERQLQENRSEPIQEILTRPLDNEWYKSRSPDWSKVVVPFLSAVNWAGFGLHPRGNFEAFTQAASKQKWLECHPGRHEEWFYLDKGCVSFIRSHAWDIQHGMISIGDMDGSCANIPKHGLPASLPGPLFERH